MGKSTSGGMKMTMINGTVLTTVVEDASFACAADSGSRILCAGYGDGGRSRGDFNNGGLGLNSQVRVWTGSHVAKASASRSGLGKTDILKYLWLRVTMSGRGNIHRVPGERNLVEHLMKGNTLCEIDELTCVV